jgi:aromatic ring hydroxylase
MHTANQMMALGCIMILFALIIGISSILLHENRRENAQIEMGIQQDMAQILYTRQSIDALHQAVQNAACILLQAKWSAEMTMTTILKTVEHAMKFHTDNSTVICPIYQ